MKPVLLIALDDGDKALPLARIDNLRLLDRCARLFIAEQRRAASRLQKRDRALGLCAREEVGRIERTLRGLIPTL